MSSKYFLIFIIFFSVGAFAGSFFGDFKYFGLFFIFLAVILLFVSKIWKFDFYVLVLVLIAFGAGLLWYEFKSIPPQDFYVLKEQTGERVSLVGVIVDEPDERENYTRYIFEYDDGVRVLLTARRHPVFKYGDRVEIKGVLKRPSFSQEFDWRAYLAKDDIYFEIFYPNIKFVEAGQASKIKQKLFELKSAILSKVSNTIPEPHASLLGGLTFGAKQSMPKSMLDDFRKTGVIHIVVLSGYNVTIVAYAIMRFFSFLPYFAGITFGAFGIIAFAIMAGGTATVVRASFMAILVLLAKATGRIYEITIALFTAGFFMVLHNPKIIRFDASFQLSFLATLALIYVAPIVETKLKFLPKKFLIREITTATIATQIFVLPLLLYKMGLFSVVSIPTNLLILAFVPATMFFGFLTAISGFVSYYISLPFAWISYTLLGYELKVVEIFASLPFASFEISHFPLWLMLTVYILYAIYILRVRNIEKMEERKNVSKNKV